MWRMLVVASVLTGCGILTDDPQTKAVNALVAPVNAAKLHFERRKIAGNPENVRNVTFSLPLPEGWRPSKERISTSVESRDGKSHIALYSNCDAMEGVPCVWQDWNAVIDDEMHFIIQTASERNERLPNHRILVYRWLEHGEYTPKLHIMVDWWATPHWWTTAGNEYFTCDVTLAAELEASAAAFEKACMSAKVTRITARSDPRD
ncbi:MAG TPA: hypothetical protein VGM88_20365 [Kofleriaceae bacterium]